MKTSLHSDYFFGSNGSKNQGSFVTLHRRNREVGNFAVRQGKFYLDIVCETTQS